MPVKQESTLSYGIFVINLPEARERRQRVWTHLGELGLDAALVEAVNGSLLTASQRLALADDAHSRARYGRALTPGELGCALSHARTYETFLAGPHPFALVLEDDALLLPDVATLLDSDATRQWLAQPVPRLLLMTPVRAFLVRGAVPFAHGYRRVRVRRAWEGYGYVVNRAAAAIMLRINTPVWLSADDWVAYRKRGRIEVCGLDPFCIGYLAAAPSQLEADRRRVGAATGGLSQFRKRVRKWGRQLMDALYYRPLWGLRQHRIPPGWPDRRA